MPAQRKIRESRATGLVSSGPVGQKRKAFYRIAGPRLREACAKLHLLSLTADLNRYEFTPKDVSYIREMLEQSLKDTLSKFERGDPNPDIRFPGELDT